MPSSCFFRDKILDDGNGWYIIAPELSYAFRIFADQNGIDEHIFKDQNILVGWIDSFWNFWQAIADPAMYLALAKVSLER